MRSSAGVNSVLWAGASGTAGPPPPGAAADGALPQWWVDQALLSTTTDLIKLQDRQVDFAQKSLGGISGMKQNKIDDSN